MRRLPVYFLIDVSESMVGEPIEKVGEGIASIIQALKADPQALETVWVSIVVFAGQAKTLVPLQDIIQFYPPKFPIGSGTSLSNGLGHLMFELGKNIKETTTSQKGDWKPIIFLFTDGKPTSDSTAAINEWCNKWKNRSNMVAVSIGDESNTPVLQKLTQDVLVFDDTKPEAYSKFFKWITASIKAQSIAVEHNEDKIDLTKIDEDVLRKPESKSVEETTNDQLLDDNYVVLEGKCQNTKKSYLIKYAKIIQEEEIGNMLLPTKLYQLKGAYPIDNSYEELSEKNNKKFVVNTEELRGMPTCPCCGNQVSVAICGCSKIHCIGNEVLNTCPWCGSQNEYGIGGTGIDINRKIG